MLLGLASFILLLIITICKLLCNTDNRFGLQFQVMDAKEQIRKRDIERYTHMTDEEKEKN
jgi:hypothetical protein